jgi:hypothetical protein
LGIILYLYSFTFLADQLVITGDPENWHIAVKTRFFFVAIAGSIRDVKAEQSEQHNWATKHMGNIIWRCPVDQKKIFGMEMVPIKRRQ